MGETPYGPFRLPRRSQMPAPRVPRLRSVEPRLQKLEKLTHPSTFIPSGYSHFMVGEPRDASYRSVAAEAPLALMGGGGDVAAAFRWLLSQAPPGRVVVLRASGGGQYNAWLHELGLSECVETFVVHEASASRDPFLVQRVRDASAVVLAGGDQWRYLKLWKGTPLERAIQSLIDRGAPVAGISAGLHVLGEFYFSAQHGTIDSAAALAAPSAKAVAIGSNFLHVERLRGVLTDSHFRNRDRMGRLLTFLARVCRTFGVEARGIGIDERTAVIAAPHGPATVMGEGNAYFVRVRPQDVAAGGELNVTHATVARLSQDNGSIDLATWTASAFEYCLRSEDGHLTSSTDSLY
jgi:cyanophycinase